MISVRPVADPQSTELNVNTMMDARRYFLRPIILANQPLIGMIMALDTRYDVRTHVTSSWPAERLPWMYGNATLATLVSKISMRVGSITAMVISHLFVPVSSMRVAQSINRRDRAHTDPQGR